VREARTGRSGRSIGPDSGLAAVGAAGGLTALLSAAACCVLPLALAAAGLGSGGLAMLVPYHWPLTAGAGVAIAAGWAVQAGKWRACRTATDCACSPSMRWTPAMLWLATTLVILSALWPYYVEPRLLGLLAGA